MPTPRVLVTGSTGFIGRRLVGRLVSQFGPRAITCLSNRPSTTLQANALQTQRGLGVRMIDVDLIDEPPSYEPAPDVDLVFHLAANIDPAATDAALTVNHIGTRHLLQWLATRPACPRIVYTSTVAVHDRAHAPTTPLRESSPLVPRTAYGRTKLQGESVIAAFGAAGGCSWTILRLPTVYGPGQKPDGLFQRLMTLTSERRWLGRINWPGRTSIIYVDDVVETMIDLGMRPDTAGEVYCVASNESLTVGKIARAIAGAVGQPIVPIELPGALWQIARAVAWSRTLHALLPPARLFMWRLSLLVSDGFWIDSTKFRSVYTRRLRDLDEGLRETLAPAPDSRPDSRDEQVIAVG